MLIYNSNSNNVKLKKDYKRVGSKRPHLSLKRGTKASTTLKVDRTKRKRLKRENIKFLKELGFEVKNK